MSKKKRTSQSLRDALFDELEELRNGAGDPTRAMAVANLAKQIINIAKVELDFHREAMKQAEGGRTIALGTMQLGSSAGRADANAMDQRESTTHDTAGSLPS